MKYFVVKADDSTAGVIFSDPKTKAFYCRAFLESFYSAFNAICDNEQVKLIRSNEDFFVELYEKGAKDWFDAVLLKLESIGYWKVDKIGNISESNEEIEKIVKKYS